MKRLGISLVGISHLTGNQRWPVSRSYLDCKENFLTHLLYPLEKKMEVKVYTTTYTSTESDNILNFYKPKKHQFLKLETSHQIITFLLNLYMLEKQDLDYLLITRFDIFFNEAFKQLQFDFNKFNFLCKEKDHWENYRFVNDCFYFLPYSMLGDLLVACKELYDNPPRPGLMDMHGLYSPLIKIIGDNNVNFLTQEHYLSSNNPVYTLKRRN